MYIYILILIAIISTYNPFISIYTFFKISSNTLLSPIFLLFDRINLLDFSFAYRLVDIYQR